jgi:hypothetical protein
MQIPHFVRDDSAFYGGARGNTAETLRALRSEEKREEGRTAEKMQIPHPEERVRDDSAFYDGALGNTAETLRTRSCVER